MKGETSFPLPLASETTGKFKGSYTCRRDKEVYALRIVPNDPKPYKLRNEFHYWEGTKEEFEKEFEV